MSEENVEMVERAITAVNARDVEAYLACCTPDIELHTPLVAVGGVYEGPAGIRRFFADVEDAAPDFRLDLERVRAIGADQVLAFLEITASGRASGLPTGMPTATATSLPTARSGVSAYSPIVSRPSKPWG